MRRTLNKLIIVAFSAAGLVASASAAAPGGPSLDERLGLAAKVGITKKLKDPNSAMFRSLMVHRGDAPTSGNYFVCGEINSKNSYGGYTGFKPFVAFVFDYPVQKKASFGTGMIWEDPSNPAPGILMAKQCSN